MAQDEEEDGQLQMKNVQEDLFIDQSDSIREDEETKREWINLFVPLAEIFSVQKRFSSLDGRLSHVDGRVQQIVLKSEEVESEGEGKLSLLIGRGCCWRWRCWCWCW